MRLGGSVRTCLDGNIVSEFQGATQGVAPTSALAWPMRLTAGIVVLLAVAAGIGAFVPGLYHDTPTINASDRGSDLLTLLLIVPALCASVAYSARGSLRAQVVWLGLVSWVLYNYVVYLFGINFTPLFLVHVALVSLSLFTLLLVIRRTDVAGLRRQFSSSMPRRSIAGFLFVVAGMFAILWLSDILPATFGGGNPARLRALQITSNPVEVNDLGVIVPLLVLAGVWTWQRREVGYLMAGILLAMATITMAALVPGGPLFAQTAIDPVSIGVAALSLGFLVVLLARAHPDGGRFDEASRGRGRGTEVSDGRTYPAPLGA